MDRGHDRWRQAMKVIVQDEYGTFISSARLPEISDEFRAHESSDWMTTQLHECSGRIRWPFTRT